MFCQYTLSALEFHRIICEIKLMADPFSGDKTFETLSALVNVLVEHERSLDQLIAGLSVVIGKLNKNEKINGQMDRILDKINNIEKEISSIVNSVQKEAPVNGEPIQIMNRTEETASALPVQESPKTTLRCYQWKDFQTLAFQAKTISYSIREGENTFQVYALKNSQVITYVGLIPQFPQFSLPLKTWLAKQISVSESLVLEGSLNLASS